jgi:ATP-dependent exoDNAse (exonuclease V) alpha subunit
MADLGMMDLPYLLKSRGGTLNDVELIGVLIGEVNQPNHMEGITFRDRDDRYALVELVGIVSQTGRYYTRGKVLVVVNKSIIAAAKAKDSGRLAVVLKGGNIKLIDRNGLNNFVQMMKWLKGNYNTWQVTKVTAENFKKLDYPEFFDVVANAFKNNWTYSYPLTVSPSYVDACEGYDFNQLLVQNNTSLVPAGVQKEEIAQEFKIPVYNPSQPSISPDMLKGLGDINLGVATGSNIATLVSNRAITHDEIKHKVKFKVENRAKLAERTENVDKFEKGIDEAAVKVREIVESLSGFNYTDSSFDSLISFTADKLKASWGSKSGFITGRMLFKEALERVLTDYDTKGLNGETVITDNLNILGSDLVNAWVDKSDYPEDNKLILAMYENRVQIYLKFIELLLGIRDKLIDALDATERSDIDMVQVLTTNPYNLCYIDPRVGIEDLDKLAMMYGIDRTNPEIAKSRNVAYMHNYMLDSSNKIIGENTVVKYQELVKNVRSGIILAKRGYDILMVEGTIIPRDRINSIAYYIHADIKDHDFMLPKANWKRVQNKYVLHQNVSAEALVQDFLDSGLGIKVSLDGVEYVSDYIFANKEMYIYNRLVELSTLTKTKEITDDAIAKCIKDFETLKAREFNLAPGEFKLEHMQAEAVALMRNPVMCLTGPAGSGKTTAAEALVYGAETLLGLESQEIMFCAPTGKAANRLKEVVKRRTRTVNSLFGIGGENLSLKSSDTIRKREDIKLLVFDESSMPTIHLIYDMLLRIADDTRIFFLGDIEQLPPIGFGKPYATMLSFLPTVVLNVGKRASDKSTITKNAKALIEESDGVIKDLVDGNDFRIINTLNEQRVVDFIKGICRYHLGQSDAVGFAPVTNLGRDLKPDDIQVISPVNGKIWGTQALNTELQNIFNKKNPNELSVNFLRNGFERTEFRINDRVIHIKKNEPNRTRLLKAGKSSFVSTKDTGVMNGEVGRVEGIYKFADIDFDLVDNEATREDLKMEFKGNPLVMFLAVAYKDLDTATGEPVEFIILYRMEELQTTGNVVDILSYDLQYLDLAYALTIHKLQGSQAKLVIIALLPVGYGDFISRNLIYTAVSRGEKADYLLGDITGSDSCVNRGRRIEQTSKRAANIDNF